MHSAINCARNTDRVGPVYQCRRLLLLRMFLPLRPLCRGKKNLLGARRRARIRAPVQESETAHPLFRYPNNRPHVQRPRLLRLQGRTPSHALNHPIHQHKAHRTPRHRSRVHHRRRQRPTRTLLAIPPHPQRSSNPTTHRITTTYRFRHSHWPAPHCSLPCAHGHYATPST